MPLELTAAQVVALAPDAAAIAASKKLARASVWAALGHSANALWGELHGAGRYQTQVALADLVSKCTCPSRKFPCKHALGLLWLAAESPASVPECAEPEWVQSRHTKRDAARAKQAARAHSKAEKPVDVAAQAKRKARRHENILAGLDQLDVWMNDLVRQGLARVQGESFAFWDAQARRLVDAQAPGLAARVRALGERVVSSDTWAERLLEDLGQLALLSHAYRRIDQLDPLLAADVRRHVGITLDQAEVIAHGAALEDEWHVLTAVIEDQERVRMQRAWLRGATTERLALVLQFAPLGARFDAALALGTKLRARLAFWPSAAPQRALVVERLAPASPLSAAPSGCDIATAQRAYAQLLASSPWAGSTLLVLADVVPLMPSGDDSYAVIDAHGTALPLRGTDHAVLLALSGGHPLTLAGEWDGYAYSPRTVWTEGRMVALGGSDE